jgi:hypothetical protein
MYIYEYDILLDKVLDSIYYNMDLKDLKLKDLEKKKINMEMYLSNLDTLKKNSNYDKIKLSTIILINMYLYFFIYLNNTSDLDNIKTYLINNKIFDTNNLGYLINLFKNYNNLEFILENINNKEKLFELYRNDINYKIIIDILNEYGVSQINLKLLIKDKLEKKHNILKLLIFKNVYSLYFRKDIFNLIFLDLNKKTTINIVNPKILKLDYFNIESLLTFSEKKLGIANEIVSLFEELDKKIFDNNDKIIDNLLNLNIVIPITDEFLRYHKIIDKINLKTDVKKSRIKNILNKNDQIKEFYSSNIKNNKIILNEISKAFYKPLAHRKAVLYNEYDEINIIQKIILAGSGSLIDYNDFLELKNLRKSSYVNFKDLKNQGVNYLTNNNFTSVRYAGIESLENKNLLDKSADIEKINISKNKSVNIVGFCILKDKNVKLKNLKDIRIINKNGIEGCKELIKKKIVGKLDENYYWIFDKNKDLLVRDEFDFNTSDFDLNFIFKHLIDFIKIEITKLIKKKLESHNNLDFYYSKKFVKYYSNKFLKFHINRKNYNFNEMNICQNNLIKKTNEIDDDNENKLYGLIGDIKKKVRDNKIIKNENIHYISYYEKKEEIVTEDSNVYCQHLIDWNKINSLKMNNVNLQKELLYKFVKKYVITNLENEYICKSCKQYLDVKNYLVNDYDGISGIDLIVNNKKKISEIKEYEKYSIVIKNLDKLIERIGRINNLNIYTGNEQIVKVRREDIIKNVIDILILHEKTLKIKNMSNLDRQLDANRKYGINNKYTNFFLFPLTNDLFKSSSEEKDKFKKIKLNTIVVYIILFMILDISRSQVTMFEFNKICNNIVYEKVKKILFNDIKVIIDDRLNTKNVLNNELLCFLVFYFSCNLSTTNTWYSNSNDISLKQKSIINTFFDFTNSLLEVFSFKNKNYLYEILCSKIINKFNMLKENEDLLDIINSRNSIKFDKDKNKILLRKSNIKSINLNNLEEIKYELNNFKFNNYFMPKKKIVNIVLDKNFLKDIYTKYRINFENKILSMYDENGFRRKINLELNEIKKMNEKVKDKILDRYESNQNIIIKTSEDKIVYKKLKIDKNSLDKFMNLVSSILKQDNIKIDNTEFNLTNSKLKIKFDFLGNIIKNNLEIFLNDKKIISKNNSYFNTNVYEIYDKVNEVKLVFNKYNLHYLGFINKNEVTDLRNNNLYAIYVPSIKEQFETLGFKKNYYKKDENINSILINTLDNIKMYISMLKDNLYLIKYKKINKSDLTDYYINRIINLNMTYDNHSLFHDLECIQFSKNIEKVSDKYYDIISKYEIKNYSNNYNNIIFYYLENIIKLIEINKNNFIKINILEFVIKNNYNYYISNFEQYFNFEIIKYKNIYNLEMDQEFVQKYEDYEITNQINEEDEEKTDEEIDEIEKNEALDIDDVDNEDDDQDVMFYGDEN